jgi:hypothetical protein
MAESKNPMKELAIDKLVISQSDSLWGLGWMLVVVVLGAGWMKDGYSH